MFKKLISSDFKFLLGGFLAAFLTLIVLIGNIYNALRPLSSFHEKKATVESVISVQGSNKKDVELKITFIGDKSYYLVKHDVKELENILKKGDQVSFLYIKRSYYGNIVKLSIRNTDVVKIEHFRSKFYNNSIYLVLFLTFIVIIIRWFYNKVFPRTPH